MQQETQNYLSRVVDGMVRVAAMVREDTNLALKSEDYLDAIHHFVAVRRATETIKTAREALDQIEDNLSKQQIPDLMRAQGVKSVKLEGVGTVGITNRVSCSMLDKTLGFEWLRGNGHGALITETVNSSTLSAFAKELLEAGEELPDDAFKISTSSYTSIRK